MQTVYSGIKSTGLPQLGNYLGALKNWKELQDTHESIYCVVDLHTLTVRNEPKELAQRTMDMFAIFLAIGYDPDKSTVYIQSHVPEHAELAWILSCYTYMGELNRMTQFKDKSAKNEDNINAGLFTYPVLMAADILLYQANLVPVGDDQKQHLEICRDIAIRFNKIYGDVFTIPDVYFGKAGKRIMDLLDPSVKMSKSDGDNNNGCIFITDTPDEIRNKMKRAKTDSSSEIIFSDDKPGVTNLLTIVQVLTGMSPEAIEAEFAGKNYGALKTRAAELIITELEPLQAKFNEYRKDPEYLKQIARKGADKAREKANITLSKVKEVIGLC
jgi:tryptophanyl-tRNA synthetase